MVRGTHEEQVAGVRRAVDAGINYFDTAPSYGDGLSETHLGAVLTELQPNAYLGSKVRLNREHLSDIRGSVRRSIEGSLSRLQRSSVDILYLHNAITQERGARPGSLGLEDVLGEEGALEALEAVRDQGLVRFIGFTAVGETDAVHQVIESGRLDVGQFYFNLLNPSASHAVLSHFYGQDFRLSMQKAVEQGMGVVNIRVMAAGALAGAERARATLRRRSAAAALWRRARTTPPTRNGPKTCDS